MKTDGFDDPSRRGELHEPHREHVLPLRGLAAKGAFGWGIEQRHPVSAADPRVEGVNLARHVSWRKPRDEHRRIYEGRIDILGPGSDHAVRVVASFACTAVSLTVCPDTKALDRYWTTAR